MTPRAILILLFCAQSNFSYRLRDDKSKRLTWPREFHLNAEKIDLASGILETMELWFKPSSYRARMDFYDGLVQKYYRFENGSNNVTVYSLELTSTEEYQNRPKCFRSVITYVEFLPNEKGYEFIGEEEFEGRLLEVWKYDTLFKKVQWIEKTLYTYPSEDGDVPVRFVRKKFLTAKSAISDHAVISYYNYEPTVDEQDVKKENTDPCEDIVDTSGLDFHEDVKHLHPAQESDVEVAFHSYKKHHRKIYLNDNEKEMRKAIFHKNWQMIVRHNRQNLGYKLELNQFADYSAEEMVRFTGRLPGPPVAATHAFPHSDDEVRALAEELPETYDMRMEGLITPIKNQAGCGSCWAFATVAAVEGALARNNGGRLVDLSEQALIDCAWGSGGRGCDGGNEALVLHYIKKHGIPMEQEYGPYLEKEGYCHMSNMTTVFTITGFAQPPVYNPQALKVALHKYGPVVVSINLSNKMRFYASGIFYDPECNNNGETDHVVVVVGWGTRGGVEYWIIKNSYGAAWGQAGYLLISAADNNCSVLSYPYYIIV